MATLLREYPERVFIGTHQGERLSLKCPSWDCGWYWGFGYLQNDECHTHLNWICDDLNTHLHGRLLHAFPNEFDKIQSLERVGKLWEFCEIVQTIYALKETAAVLGRGGSHYTNNPCRDIVKNPEEVKRINEVVIPHLIDAMYVCLGSVSPMEK